jgi:hypothetical protein
MRRLLDEAGEVFHEVGVTTECSGQEGDSCFENRNHASKLEGCTVQPLHFPEREREGGCLSATPRDLMSRLVSASATSTDGTQ